MALHFFSVFKETQKIFESQNIIHIGLETTTSTNSLAKEEAFALSSTLKCYIADQQTQGRGRGDHSWLNSNPGHALLCTYSFAVPHPPQPITTALAGLRIYQALSLIFKNLNWSLKAPNDILLNEKKVCGLLIESQQMGASCRLIIGIGLNVFSAPPEIKDATSLAQETPISQSDWQLFVTELTNAMRAVADGSAKTALSPTEREQLLLALNRNAKLKTTFAQVSPFADLVDINGDSISWRDL